MKMLIDITGDFESYAEILDLVDQKLNGTSYTVDILWSDDDGIKKYAQEIVTNRVRG